MPAINKIPDVLQNFRLYKDDTALIGTVDIELPELESLTETLSGSGIAGEIESPVTGHTKSLVCKLKYRALTKDLLALAAPKGHLLTARGSVQEYDAGGAAYGSYPVKLVMQGPVKKLGAGKMEPGKKQENGVEVECFYLKISVDDVDCLEIDKLNCKYVVDGVDYLAQTRIHLGMEA
jgi:P2 family phage contractile tail tube protein